MATVKCLYCEEKFDRDKIAYVKPRSNRYAHASCYLRKKETDKTTPELEIFDPADVVICCVCKKPISKKNDKFKQMGPNQYAHYPECYELEQNREKTDAELLNNYIMNLFNWDYVHPRVKKQINSYIETYNFTYSGIQKSLEYFYDIKGNDLQNAHGSIGIVPYIYQDAYEYFYRIWKARQRNENVHAKDFIPRIKEVRIPPPQARFKERKLFTFLDEEEEINEQQ